MLTNGLVGSRAAKYGAAVIVALDPLAMTYANMIRNEMFFTTLLVVGTMLWQASLARSRKAAVAGAGLVFGLATLIRPVTSY